MGVMKWGATAVVAVGGVAFSPVSASAQGRGGGRGPGGPLFIGGQEFASRGGMGFGTGGAGGQHVVVGGMGMGMGMGGGQCGGQQNGQQQFVVQQNAQSPGPIVLQIQQQIQQQIQDQQTWQAWVKQQQAARAALQQQQQQAVPPWQLPPANPRQGRARGG